MPRAPSVRAIVASAAVALSMGLGFIAIADGFSDSVLLRLLEGASLLVLGAVVLSLVIGVAVPRMADWRDPASEAEFERVVQRSERLAQEGTAAEPDEGEFLDLDPYDDEDFEELVRDALDDLPDLLRVLVERHNVAVVISDGGRRRGAYGLYHGDGATRDDVPDRIVIYRDTLRRDFGHDPDLLRAQVTQTVRHELAHHVGFDELGVRDLGL